MLGESDLPNVGGGELKIDFSGSTDYFILRNEKIPFRGFCKLLMLVWSNYITKDHKQVYVTGDRKKDAVAVIFSNWFDFPSPFILFSCLRQLVIEEFSTTFRSTRECLRRSLIHLILTFILSRVYEPRRKSFMNETFSWHFSKKTVWCEWNVSMNDGVSAIALKMKNWNVAKLSRISTSLGDFMEISFASQLPQLNRFCLIYPLSSLSSHDFFDFHFSVSRQLSHRVKSLHHKTVFGFRWI